MNENKPALVVNLILVIIGIIALIHDIYAFGSKLFEWYTIDSNVLQLVISGSIIYGSFGVAIIINKSSIKIIHP